jgi:hypothetical protein
MSSAHDNPQMQLLELHKKLHYETTNNFQQRQINAEKEYCHGVLKRIVACIQYLAKQNNAFRGTSSKVYTINNGKLIALIIIISEFDMLMAEYLRQISRKGISDH